MNLNIRKENLLKGGVVASLGVILATVAFNNAKLKEYDSFKTNFEGIYLEEMGFENEEGMKKYNDFFLKGMKITRNSSYKEIKTLNKELEKFNEETSNDTANVLSLLNIGIERMEKDEKTNAIIDKRDSLMNSFKFDNVVPTYLLLQEIKTDLGNLIAVFAMLDMNPNLSEDEVGDLYDKRVEEGFEKASANGSTDSLDVMRNINNEIINEWAKTRK